MVCISTVVNGKMFSKCCSDNWFNVYLNRARFENLEVKIISEVEYKITIKGQEYTVTSDKRIDRRY